MLLDNRLLNLDEPGWLYELKYDGHCTLGEFGEGSCRVKTHKCHHPSGAIRVEVALWRTRFQFAPANSLLVWNAGPTLYVQVAGDEWWRRVEHAEDPHT